MTPTERVRSVLDALEAHPRVAWVTRAQSGVVVARGGRRIHMCKQGTPDIVGFLRDGRFLGLEVKADRAELERKREKDETRIAQRKLGALLSACGGVYGLVCSAEEAVELLR